VTRQSLRRALMLLLALMIVGAGLSAPLPARADDSTKVLLLLDVSGSMNERISSGGSKFAAAKRALKQVADALPAGTQVGLRVYGSEIAEPKETNPKACRDTELVLPVGPLDSKKMYRAVDSFKAVGETPIAYSLDKAVDDLGDKGRRVLVLISDGEESCAGDPCPVARKLADKGVDLQFNAVGLDVGGKARKQLKCIADAGDGSYYDADQADELSDALRKITQRALRPFAITGTPVRGTDGPEDAPAITVGQYQDRFGPDDGKRYYNVTRRPGDTVTVSANSLVPPTGSYNAEYWYLALTTASGASCDNAETVNETTTATLVVSAAVVSGDKSPGCATEPLVLSVERRSNTGNKKAAPAEILVATEPPITNLGSLPGPIATYKVTGSSAPQKKPVKAAVSGTSFTDAPILVPGSYSDTPAVGESILYGVRLEPGQRLRASVTAPSKAGWDLEPTDTVTVATVLYTPSRVPLTKQSVILQGDRRGRATAYSPEVRVRNREIPHGSAVTTEGDLRENASYASAGGVYYVSVQLKPGRTDLRGRVAPVRIDLAVDGTAKGQPQFASDASPSTTPSPSGPPTASGSPSASGSPQSVEPSATDPGQSTDGGGPGVGALAVAAGAGAALVLLAGLVGALLLRRSRAARATTKRSE
jgi:Ca-activated chloride channel homolog